MTKPVIPTPADYAAALLAAAQELPAERHLSLLEGFIRVLDEDDARPAWPEISRALEVHGLHRSARVARADDRTAVAAILGDAADIGVDPRLLGGAVIRSGEIEIDSSIAGQLRQLAEHLRAGS